MVDNVLVKVRFFAWLREEIGMREITIKCKGTLRDLLECIRSMLKDKADRIFSDGRIRKGVIIAINNKVVDTKDINKIILENEDVIDIMPLGSGG